MEKLAFVTGGTGFLGQNLLHALREERWKVVALVRDRAKAQMLRALGAEPVEGDLSSVALLTKLMPEAVDAVFHVAANISMWKREAAQTFRDNVDGTRALLEAARARHARRFVLTSTAAVFGLSHERFDEHSELRGASTAIPYVLSKLEAERALLEASARGLPGVILNPGHIIGAHDRHGWARLFVDAKAGRLTMAPTGVGTWAHAGALARAHVAAATRGEPSQRYLLGGVVASYAEVATRAAAMVGARAPRRAPSWLIALAARASALRSRVSGVAPDVSPELARILTGRLVFDSAHAERELGYRPASLDAMLEDALASLESEQLL